MRQNPVSLQTSPPAPPGAFLDCGQGGAAEGLRGAGCPCRNAVSPRRSGDGDRGRCHRWGGGQGAAAGSWREGACEGSPVCRAGEGERGGPHAPPAARSPFCLPRGGSPVRSHPETYRGAEAAGATGNLPVPTRKPHQHHPVPPPLSPCAFFFCLSPFSLLHCLHPRRPSPWGGQKKLQRCVPLCVCACVCVRV